MKIIFAKAKLTKVGLLKDFSAYTHKLVLSSILIINGILVRFREASKSLVGPMLCEVF